MNDFYHDDHNRSKQCIHVSLLLWYLSIRESYIGVGVTIIQLTNVVNRAFLQRLIPRHTYTWKEP